METSMWSCEMYDNVDSRGIVYNNRGTEQAVS